MDRLPEKENVCLFVLKKKIPLFKAQSDEQSHIPISKANKMKRKALKIKLLFSIFTISCLSAFSQGVNKNVREIWFPALKAQTGGDNWTIKTMDDLLGRTASPFFKKGAANTSLQQDVPASVEKRPASLEIVDLSNNNLNGVIDNDDQMTWTYLNPGKQEAGRFYHNTSFRFSHNKLTSVRAKLAYASGKAKDLWFDHNLLTTFEPIPQTVSGNGNSGAVNSVRINNNQLKGIPASWIGSGGNQGGLPFTEEGIKEFRAENNFFNFTDLIKLRSLIRKKQNIFVGCNRCGNRLPNGAPYFILGIAPQNPLGEENTAKTVAEGEVVELVFDIERTITTHGNNAYSWQLNGKDIPSNYIHNFSMGVFTAGVYRCKITNPEILGVALYSRDFPVFMTKAGNQVPTDLTLDNASAPAKTPTDAIIGTFSGTDADNDDLYFRLYNILGDNSSFRIIDGNTLISSTVLFEYSYQQSYTLKVEAYDIYGGTFQKDIVITRGAAITGAFPTNIKLSGNTIAENTAAKVGDIQLVGVSDATGFTYELIANAKDNALFEVVGAALQVKDGLNFEQKNVYTVRLKVANSGGIPLTKDLLINVTNENDPPGNLLITNSQVMIGQASGTLVGTLYATDDDLTDHNFTFAVEENDFFTIVRKKQVVTKKQFIASEAATKDLTITVSDADSEQTFTLSIEITSTTATAPPIDDGTDVPDVPNNRPNRTRLFGNKLPHIDQVATNKCFGQKSYDLDTYFEDPDGDLLYYILTSGANPNVSIALQGRNTLVVKEHSPATNSSHRYAVNISVDDHKGGKLFYKFEFKLNKSPIENCACRGTALGLVEEERLPASIYPVPVQDLLHIALDKPTSGTVNIRIQSLSGRQVYAKSFAVTSGQTVKQIEVNNLYAGMYLVIVSSNDLVQKFKMLKQ